MGIITNLLLGILGATFLSWLLLTPLTRKYKNELRRKSNEELAAEVFRYETDYFSFIGEDNDVVKQFKFFIENRELIAIRKNWKMFSSVFKKLERNAGHSGRPLIMDYYLWYEVSLNEMYKRNYT